MKIKKLFNGKQIEKKTTLNHTRIISVKGGIIFSQSV